MSEGLASNTWRGQHSHAASRSRCRCTAALGRPVVPLVNAIMATSVASVGQAMNSPLLAAHSCPKSCAPSELKQIVRSVFAEAFDAASNSASHCPSHNASAGCALLMISPSSLARSSGMLATAIKPAFTTASQHSAMPIELGPRNSTRLPGTSWQSSMRYAAMRLTTCCASR